MHGTIPRDVTSLLELGLGALRISQVETVVVGFHSGLGVFGGGRHTSGSDGNRVGWWEG